MAGIKGRTLPGLDRAVSESGKKATDIAAAAEIDYATLWRLRRMKRGASDEVTRRLSKALGVPLKKLSQEIAN